MDLLDPLQMNKGVPGDKAQPVQATRARSPTQTNLPLSPVLLFDLTTALLHGIDSLSSALASSFRHGMDF
jgi:hypothetical protein